MNELKLNNYPFEIEHIYLLGLINLRANKFADAAKRFFRCN
jgi:hypothetical protein